MSPAHPQLVSAKLKKLHPTQITVGKAEVELKRKEWSELGKKARRSALESHWFPAVQGPEGRHYIVDHHHFGLALLEQGVKNVWLLILKDLSWLVTEQFWTVMDHNQWAHPYDKEGIRRDFSSIPGRLESMQDDPYRSLAGELRRTGGFAKDVAPFSEFLWADFFRIHIPHDIVEQHFPKALDPGHETGP